MPKFNITLPHPLSQQDAIDRLSRFAETLREKFQDKVSDLKQSWDGNVLNFGFKTYGIAIAGKITVTDKQLVVDGDLPFTAMMFKGKIETEIREQLAKLLGAPK